MVLILGGGQNAAVGRPLPMQPFVMPAVVGYDGTAQRMRTRQNIRVRRRASTVLLSGHDIVTESPQFFHRRQGKVLVGVEPHPLLLHKPFLAFFVRPDGFIHFVRVGVGVLPGRF